MVFVDSFFLTDSFKIYIYFVCIIDTTQEIKESERETEAVIFVVFTYVLCRLLK